MVAGMGDDLAVAHQIEARIAGVRPVRDAVLNDAGDTGGARRVAQAVARGVVEDRMVGIAHAFLQEAELQAIPSSNTTPSTRAAPVVLSSAPTTKTAFVGM